MISQISAFRYIFDLLIYFDHLLTISVEQMLTSKDANFIGYTFKKSDLKSAGTAGIRSPSLRLKDSFCFDRSQKI